MKKIFTILVFICFYSCKQPTPKDLLIEKAEIELKKSMHDPSSYEFVSFEEDIQKQSDELIKSNELGIEPQYKSNVRYYKLIYRGKNMMGALILNEKYVVCSNDEDLTFYFFTN